MEALIAAAISLISSLIASGKDAEAQAIREKMAANFGPEILPVLDKATAETGGPSKFEGLVENGDTRRGQMDVADELGRIYDTGGNTQADMAAYDVARREVSQRAASNAGNTSLEAARRGQVGGPLSSVLATQAGQSELDALGNMNAQIASGSRDRALAALRARGGMLGDVRGKDFDVASTKASAIDLMNRFAATQKQQANMHNLNIPQQNFLNKLQQLNGQSAALNGVAGGLSQAGQDIRVTGAGVANGVTSYGQAWDDEPKKHDDEDGAH